MVVKGEYPPFIANVNAIKVAEDGTPDYLQYLKGLQGEHVTADGEPVARPLFLSAEDCEKVMIDIIPQLNADQVTGEV